MIGKYYPAYHGGMENQLLQFCKSVDTDIELEVIACNDENYSIVEHINNVTILRKRAFGEVFSTPISFDFFSAILHSNTDLFHLHSPNPIAELALLLQREKPFIVSYHSDVLKYQGLRYLYRALLVEILRKSRKILVASDNYLNSSPILSIFRDKCEVIPYGIDINDFSVTPNVRHKINENRCLFGKRIVLFVGRFRPYKGVEYLIRAMKNVRGVLLLAGKGALGRKYKELIRKLNLEDKILFLGDLSHEDLVAAYHSCDVFVLPSVNRAESFGMVLLEAMACGKPVISTELGTATSWVNISGETGFVVPASNCEALSDAITMILNNIDLAKSIGEAGMLRVKNEFTSMQMSKRTIAVYNEIL